ncbi:MAG: hypothetical protein ACO394_13265 [Blastocatellia bacterium]
MKSKKSWREKLTDKKDLPKVVPVPASMVGRWGITSPEETLLIPSPEEVDQMMKRVPEGSLTTLPEIRAALADEHQATVCCPLTTGIFAVIAAQAAEEEARETGSEEVTPWWRTLQGDGRLNPKFTGGIELQAARLEAEGHRVVGRGSTRRVEAWECLLAPLLPAPPRQAKGKVKVGRSGRNPDANGSSRPLTK